MTDSQKRRDEAAERYATGNHRTLIPDTYDEIAFRHGWDARDRDLKERLGLPQDCDIEDVMKQKEAALGGIVKDHTEDWIRIQDAECERDQWKDMVEKLVGVLEKQASISGYSVLARKVLSQFERMKK